MIISSLLAVILGSAAHAADAKTIKFATLAPEGSTWMNVMSELNDELVKKTNGALKFKFFAGGVQGDEKDVVKKIRINQLHAAGFTGVGIGEVAPEARILDAPWLFRNDKEVDFVYKTFDKQLTAAVEKGGYVLLGWTELGWVYVFTKNPVASPEDIKKQKMWVWEGDPIARAAYDALSVTPISLPVIDVMSSLQTGLIDGVYGPPMGVVALQWFTRTKHIYSMPMADSSGAVLLSKSFFDKLPADQQKTLKEVAAKHLRRLNELSRQENRDALASLQKQGLVLSDKPSAAQVKQFEELGKKARKQLAGKLYSADLLDKIEKALEDFRAGKSEGGKPKKG
jgi:TRAP-type transport system periplasmic protein